MKSNQDELKPLEIQKNSLKFMLCLIFVCKYVCYVRQYILFLIFISSRSLPLINYSATAPAMSLFYSVSSYGFYFLFMNSLDPNETQYAIFFIINNVHNNESTALHVLLFYCQHITNITLRVVQEVNLTAKFVLETEACLSDIINELLN